MHTDLVPLAWLSAASLLIAAILCLIGMLAKAFNDNLFQTLAMALGLVGYSSRFTVMAAANEVPFDWLLVHLSVGLFAIGTAWKVIKYSDWYKAFRTRLAEKRAERRHAHDLMPAELHDHNHIL